MRRPALGWLAVLAVPTVLVAPMELMEVAVLAVPTEPTEVAVAGRREETLHGRGPGARGSACSSATVLEARAAPWSLVRCSMSSSAVVPTKLPHSVQGKWCLA